MPEKQYAKHYQDSRLIPAPAQDVFAYVDDHSKYYSHVIEFARVLGGVWSCKQMKSAAKLSVHISDSWAKFLAGRSHWKRL